MWFNYIGAGGSDAVFVITLSSEVASKVTEMWNVFTDVSICPLVLNAAQEVSGINIQQERRTLVIEGANWSL